MSLPFRTSRSWIVSSHATQRFIVWLGYGNGFTLFAKQSSGGLVTITVMEYCMEGQISSDIIILENGAHTKIYDERNTSGTHLVLAVDGNVATPGISIYGYGRN